MLVCGATRSSSPACLLCLVAWGRAEWTGIKGGGGGGAGSRWAAVRGACPRKIEGGRGDADASAALCLS